MDPVQVPERQDASDIHDVTSWVSVCSRGLCKVQRRRTHDRGRQTTSNAGDDGCMVFFLTYILLNENYPFS